MTRRIPWLLAAIPGALAGHTLAYALTGQAQSDPRHGYLVPALQYSVLLLSVVCSIMLVRALSRSTRVRGGALQMGQLWGRLAIAQILFYVAVESVEGFSVSAAAVIAQVLVALVVAAGLVLFARLLFDCERAAHAGRYLQRLHESPLHAFFNDRSPAYTLCVAAGSARFQRPPPQK